MADDGLPLSDLNPAGALDGTELAYVVKSGASRSTTTQAIADLGGGGGGGGSVANIAALEAVTGMADGDYIVLSEAGREGTFIFDAADKSAFVTADAEQGVFVAPAATPTGASGAWVRVFIGPLQIDWFGADRVTNRGSSSGAKTTAAAANEAAWMGIKSVAIALRSNSIGASGEPSTRSTLWFFGAPVIEFGLGNYWYGGNELIHAEGTFIIRGQGSGTTKGHGAATRLQWDDSCNGLVLHEWKSYAGAEQVAPDASTSNTLITDICFEGGAGALTNSRIGVWMRSNGCTIDRCSFVDWAYAGVVVGTRPGMGDVHGANLCWVKNSNFLYCGTAGLIFDGADSSAGGSENCSFIYCGRYGLWDSSFLACKHEGHHSRGTAYGGMAGTSTHKISVRSIVNHNGYYWGRVPGTDTGSDVTEPGDDPYIWSPFLASGGSPNTTYAPNWVTGTAYNGACSYYGENVTAPSVFIGCYNEGDGLGVFLASPSFTIGGTVANATPTQVGAHLGMTETSLMNYTGGIGVYEKRYSSAVSDGTVPSSIRKIKLGGGYNNNDLFYVQDSLKAPSAYRCRMDTEGNLYLFDYGNNGVTAAIFKTGPSTTYTFGRSAAVPDAHVMNRLWVGSGSSFNEARRQTNGTAAPSAGAWARGDICWNRNAAAATALGWVCVTAGTPGTWVEIWADRTPLIQSVSSSATVTPTFANDQVNITAQAAGLTLANPTGTAVDGWGIAIRIKDNGTARAISYGTQYRAIGVTLPTTTVIGKTLYIGMIFNNADTKWDVTAVAQEA